MYLAEMKWKQRGELYKETLINHFVMTTAFKEQVTSLVSKSLITLMQIKTDTIPEVLSLVF